MGAVKLVRSTVGNAHPLRTVYFVRLDLSLKKMEHALLAFSTANNVTTNIHARVV